MSNNAQQAGASNVAASDFLLGPEAFVDACAHAYGMSEAELSSPERGALADAIKAGRPRFEVLKAIRSRRNPQDPSLEPLSASSLAREWDGFVVIDLLERYAPDDDESFVRQVYAQTLAREPSALEVIETTFDLKSRRVDRRQVIETLTARGGRSRLSPDPALTEKPSGFVNGGLAFSEAGHLKIVFLKYTPSVGWVVAPDVWLQPIQPQDNTWHLSEGWVMTGPKRSLPSGPWRLDLDFVQAEAAELVIDVVANSGIDTLVKMTLVGPAHLSPRFEIKPWHHFLEVRVFKPPQPDSLRWLKVRELSLSAVS